MTVVSYISLEEFKKKYPDLDIEQYAVVDDKVKLKADGTPAKKRGFKKGAVRRFSKVKGANKKKKANKKIASKKVKTATRAAKKVASNPKKSIISKEAIKGANLAGKRILFEPNPGPQTDFLAAPEKDVLYGGAAGGGKSYAMLVDPLRYAHREQHRALILRRSMPELRELIDKSRELYPKAFIGAKFREVDKIWKFPSGV